MTQIENQAWDGLRFGQASLKDVAVKVARELSAYGRSEWMRPSTRAVMFRRLQGQGPPLRPPGLRRAEGARVAQMVGQDAGRSPRRPAGVADRDARCSGNRPHTLAVGAGPARSRRLPVTWQAALALCRQPPPMGKRPERSETPSARRPGSRRFGNREGCLMAKSQMVQMERLLTVAEVAELLGTTERFPGG